MAFSSYWINKLMCRVSEAWGQQGGLRGCLKKQPNFGPSVILWSRTVHRDKKFQIFLDKPFKWNVYLSFMRRKKFSPKKNFSQFFGEKNFFSHLKKIRFPTWEFFATQHDFSSIPIGQLSKIKKAYLGFVLEKSN